MNELYHHGIKGQKWGVRRFQDKNGNWTDAGLKRRELNERDGKSSRARAAKKAENARVNHAVNSIEAQRIAIGAGNKIAGALAKSAVDATKYGEKNPMTGNLVGGAVEAAGAVANRYRSAKQLRSLARTDKQRAAVNKAIQNEGRRTTARILTSAAVGLAAASIGRKDPDVARGMMTANRLLNAGFMIGIEAKYASESKAALKK